LLISFWISCIKFELILTLETGIMVAWFQLEYSIRFFRYVAFSGVLETSIAIEVSKSLRWLSHIFPIGQFSSARNTMIFDGLEIETERTKNIYFSFSRAHRTHRMYFIVCLGNQLFSYHRWLLFHSLVVFNIFFSCSYLHRKQIIVSLLSIALLSFCQVVIDYCYISN